MFTSYFFCILPPPARYSISYINKVYAHKTPSPSTYKI